MQSSAKARVEEALWVSLLTARTPESCSSPELAGHLNQPVVYLYQLCRTPPPLPLASSLTYMEK